jgi:type I restriction enzyme R subunit
LLKAQGWTITPFDPATPPANFTAHALTEYNTANGPADYALFVAGQPLGIVEAKKITLGPQNVLSQAERYSRGGADSPFDFSGFRVPFLYSTNGEILWFHDIRHELNRSRRIATFHKPAALQEMLARDLDASCSWFAATPNRHPLLRPYQACPSTGRTSTMSLCCSMPAAGSRQTGRSTISWKASFSPSMKRSPLSESSKE